MIGFITLSGIGNHTVLLPAEDIRDVRHDYDTGARAVVTDKETYRVQNTTAEIIQKLQELGIDIE